MPVMRRTTDRCLSCGRFVGHYPVGFYCDTHCSRCVCTRCPGFREPPPATRVIQTGTSTIAPGHSVRLA